MRLTRPTVWPVALLLLAAFAMPARADRDDVVVRDETAAFPIEGARTLRIDVPVGEVHVEVGGGDRVEARLTLECDEDSRRCRERAAKLRLASDRSADDLSLRISGYQRERNHGIHHPDVTLRLTVPAAISLEVDMGVGELDVEGVEGDVEVDLGVGEVRVALPESAVRSVSLDVGVGEANLSPRPADTQRHGFLFLGNEVDWKDGSGPSRVAVNVGVGEASVRLRP
jgi:hypothetical protein